MKTEYIKLILCIAVILSSLAIARYLVGASWGYSVLFSLAVGLVVVLFVFVVLKNSWKESFDAGYVQNIYISQGCGKVSPGGISDWIKGINGTLTPACVACVKSSAEKLWSADTLEKVKEMNIDQQKKILNMLLAFDCSKQCSVPSNELDEDRVRTWVNSIIPSSSLVCVPCVVSSIMKMWKLSDFQNALAKSTSDQQKLIGYIIIMNCGDCSVLNPQEIRAWLNGVLSGALPSCYACIVDFIQKMWSEKDLKKVKSLDKKSQLQIVQALIAVNCEKNCAPVPSGLTISMVMPLVQKFVPNEGCGLCAAEAMVKSWTPIVFASVMKKSVQDQKLIVEALMSLNCEGKCSCDNDECRYPLLE